MNLLIVDDEMIAIEGIRANTDWEKLHFDHIYTANSYAQAVDLVTKNRVDVMLCDIEMPGESGLELIRWMNENSPDTVNIILTCHEDFQFAKRAVALSCMDYILKPATPAVLMDVLGRAEERAGLPAVRKSGITAMGSSMCSLWLIRGRTERMQDSPAGKRTEMRWNRQSST